MTPSSLSDAVLEVACEIDDREDESPSPLEPRTEADVPQLGDRSPP
jgi:hypothetical protein